MATLVVMSGLPCSGKTSVGHEIARRCNMFMVELDHLEGPLLEQGIGGDALGWAGYEMMTALARDNLLLQHSIVLDAVAWNNEIRARWRQLATETQAAYRAIEVICSDESLYRARVNARERSIPGVPEVDWERVEWAKGMYEPWVGDRLQLDSVKPIDTLVDQAVAYVRS